MKRLLILLSSILPVLAIAQNLEGEVLFEETIKLNIELPNGNKQMLAMMPKSQTAQRVLFFNQESSLYKNAEESQDGSEIEQTEGGMQFKTMVVQSDNQLFKDLQNGKKVERRELFGKKFLISGGLKTHDWKLTGEQKKIQGYVCNKAMLQDTSRSVAAWFTSQIPIPTGPGEFGQLPGMILEVNIDDGERTIVANKITMKSLPEDAFKVPTKGKTVTQEEFDKIAKEKAKEMQEEMGGSGNIMIKIRN